MANETTHTIDIDVPAQSVEAAAAAVDSLAARLAQAQTVSSGLAARVKEGEAAYKQAEAAANSAAKALERINAQMATASGDRLTQLTMRQIEAAQKAYQTADALKAEANALDKLKTAAAGAADQQKNVAKQLDAAKAAADKAAKAQQAAAGSGKVNEIAEGLGKLGGPLGSIGQKVFGAADAFKKLTGSMGSGALYAAVAVGIAAIAAAIVAAAIAAGSWAIKMADAARAQLFLTAGIAGSVAAGRDLDKKISELEDRLPQTGDELRQMAGELAKTGLKGQALSDALENAAIKAAELKGGPGWAKMANSLSKLSSRLQSKIVDLFKGPAVQGALDKFTEGLSLVVSLFDQSNASGRLMKSVIEAVFGGGIASVGDFVAKARSGFIQLEILVVKAAIALKPYSGQLEAMLPMLKEVGILAAISFGILIASAVAVVAAIVICVAALVWFYQGIVDGGKAVWAFATSLRDGLVANFNSVVAKVSEVIEKLRGMSLGEIARFLIEGLANGIKASGQLVLDAITGVVKGAIGAAKNLLGIQSPSTVFAEIGANTAAGMAGGVESGTGAVQSALETMASPADAASAGSSAPAPSASNGGNSYTFVFHGVDGAEDATGRFEDLLEGDYTQIGLAVPG